MSYKYNTTIHEMQNGGANPGAWGAWSDGPEGSRINTSYEPQRLNNFEFVIASKDFANLRYPGTTTAQGKIISDTNPSETIRLAVKSAFIPHFKQDVITLKRGNSSLKYAGSASFDGGSLTVHDFIGGNAKALIMAWQNLSYNTATEKVGLAADYKKTCELVEYTPDYQIVRRWRLYGCWIDSISEGTYDYDGSDTNKVEISIQYDKAEIVQDTPAGY